jgi:hypothetical protein
MLVFERRLRTLAFTRRRYEEEPEDGAVEAARSVERCAPDAKARRPGVDRLALGRIHEVPHSVRRIPTSRQGGASERIMKRFKSARQTRRCLSVHDQVGNLFPHSLSWIRRRAGHSPRQARGSPCDLVRVAKTGVAASSHQVEIASSQLTPPRLTVPTERPGRGAPDQRFRSISRGVGAPSSTLS